MRISLLNCQILRQIKSALQIQFVSTCIDKQTQVAMAFRGLFICFALLSFANCFSGFESNKTRFKIASALFALAFLTADLLIFAFYASFNSQFVHILCVYCLAFGQFLLVRAKNQVSTGDF